MIKRTIISVVAMILFLGIITSVGYGQTKSSILTKAQVEKLAKEKLNIGGEYKLQYGNLYTRDIQQRQFWNLDFEGENKYISVIIAADSGGIVSFNQWGNEDHKNAVTLLRDEAKKIAIDFIKSLENEKFKETEEIDVKAPSFITYYLYEGEQNSDNYCFMFIRKLKDEFFPDNYFIVNVSCYRIISYEMKWDLINYEQNNQLLDEQKIRNYSRRK